MRRAEALAIIAAHEEELRRDYYVSYLAIFGSVARDEAREDSDVDILVEFDRPVGLFHFIGLQHHLEELLGKRVDLGTPDSIKPRLRDQILEEAIRAA